MPAPVSEKILGIAALVVTLGCTLFGLFAFYSRYEYAEIGHDYLVMGYLAACAVLFAGIRLWRIFLIVLALFFIVGIQAYSSAKFSWRQNYVTLAQIGQPFFLDEFIDHYPTFEQHMFKFLKYPDYVRFNSECIQPALGRMATRASCASLGNIQDNYNIDVVQMMNSYFAKMQRTAKMVEEGKMLKRTAYADCIANKLCATIPLLPKGVDAAKIDPTSKDHIGIRQAFWSLINDRKMSEQVCALTPMCRALVYMKVVDASKLPF